jgi:hypothetical protein
MSAVNLFDALGVIPALPGARCRRRSALFDLRALDDPARLDAEATALRLCQLCPAAEPCRRWFDALPPRRRPHGVIAGRVNRPHQPGRPSKAAVS